MSAPILVQSPKDITVRVNPAEWQVPLVLGEFEIFLRTRDLELEYRILRVLTEDANMIARLFRSEPTKDRYRDIHPFFENRVVLEGGGYVNASFMPSHDGLVEKAYIACQGPLNGTMRDHWAMVWENSVHAIFAIGHLREGGVEKCVKYWPSGVGSVMSGVGEFEILVESEELLMHGALKLTKLKVTRSPHESSVSVSHYHFTGWPDHGIVEPIHLVGLVRELNRWVKRGTFEGLHPVVVHCSAGVGRTGCVLTLSHIMESVLQQMVSGKSLRDCRVSVLKTALNLRKYRLYMLQRTGQYVLIYQCLALLVAKHPGEFSHQLI